MCGPGPKRILGPVMLGVTPPKSFSNGIVTVLPESRQILSDLHRAAGWREQMNHEGLPAVGHHRGVFLTKHFLQADGQNRGIGRVIDGKPPPAGHHQVRRGEPIERALLTPIQATG